MVTRPVSGKPRRICPECNYIYFTDPKVGVGVLLIEDGQALLVRRAVEPQKGLWSIPAGYVDRGEDPQQAAVREVAEETGLEIAISDLLAVYYNPPGLGGASIFIAYLGTRTGGTLQAGDDADAAEFFALDELPPLAFESNAAVLAAALTSGE